MNISNIGIVGYGSIGIKHYKTIKKINKNIKVSFIRIKNQKKILNKNINSINIKDISKFSFDCVFICTPSTNHLEIAKIFIKKNIPTFIEKPVTDDFKKLIKFKDLFLYAINNKIIINIGYVLKHSNSYKKFKEILSNNSFGKIISITSNCNSNLLNWRKSFLQSSVSTNKKLGGGVLNELSHEIDYINDLFGNIISVYANINKIKKFNINCEEYADIIMINKNKIPIKLHLDFNSLFSKRFCEVKFERGVIIWEIKKNKITIINNKNNKKTYINKSDMYKNQIKYFFDLIKNKKLDTKNLNNSFEVIKIINLIKKSDTKRIELRNI